MRNSRLIRLGVTIATLVGALFFNVIVGVFGLGIAIGGLAAFLVGAVVICREYVPSETVIIRLPPNRRVLRTSGLRVSMQKRHSEKTK